MDRDWNRRKVKKTRVYVRLGNVSVQARKNERIRDALIRTHRALGATLGEARTRAGQTLGHEVEDLLRRLLVKHVGSANVAWLNAVGAQPEGDFIVGSHLVEVKSTCSDNGSIKFDMEPTEVDGHRHLGATLGAPQELCMLVVFHRDSTFHLLTANRFGYHNPRSMRLVGHYCARCQKGRQTWRDCEHTTGDRLGDVI